VGRCCKSRAQGLDGMISPIIGFVGVEWWLRFFLMYAARPLLKIIIKATISMHRPGVSSSFSIFIIIVHGHVRSSLP
jgi:hypothetical protein